MPTAANLFRALWLFVIFVSVFDGYLVLRYRDSLSEHERNPLGLALIELNGGGVWYLLVAKCIGTVAAASLILLIYERNARLGFTISVLLASLQLWLLLHLIFA